jgi:altronate dehydratase small subunit
MHPADPERPTAAAAPDELAAPAAFRVHPQDSVATLLRPAGPGTIQVAGEGPISIHLTRAIEAAHKVALRPIASGEDVFKFGHPIGRATADIAVGDWVHLHNLASLYDERAAHYDGQTGVPDDNESAYV